MSLTALVVAILALSLWTKTLIVLRRAHRKRVGEHLDFSRQAQR